VILPPLVFPALSYLRVVSSPLGWVLFAFFVGPIQRKNKQIFTFFGAEDMIASGKKDLKNMLILSFARLWDLGWTLRGEQVQLVGLNLWPVL
jgi:hypothetical protein